MARLRGELATAEERFRDTLAILQTLPGSFERDSAACYLSMQLATTLVAMGGDLREAESLAREAVGFFKNVDPQETGWYTSHARSVLGEALSAQGKHAEAEPLLLGAYRGIKAHDASVPARNHREVIQRLIAHYESTGAAELEEWRETLASFEASLTAKGDAAGPAGGKEPPAPE